MKNNLTLEMIMERFHDWTINLYTKDDTEIIGKYDKYLNYPVEHAEITDMAGDITVSVYLDKNKEFTVDFNRKFCFRCNVSAKNMDEAESIAIKKTDDFASALYNMLKEESKKSDVDFYGECDLGNDIYIRSEDGDIKEVELF